MGTLATNYYLKALDNYPYDLPEVIESLDYALSYDDEHADAHCLMGRLCMDYLVDFEKAKYHFESALYHDVKNIRTYYCFIDLCISTEDYASVDRLLTFARKIKGIDRSFLLQKEALMYEKQKKYRKAEKLLKEAMKTSVYTGAIDFYRNEKQRVKDKMPAKKKKKPKKSKK